MDLAAELYSYYQLAAKVTNVGGLEGPRERLSGPGDNVLGSMKDPSISFPLTARQSLRATEPELSVNEMEDIVPGSPHARAGEALATPLSTPLGQAFTEGNPGLLTANRIQDRSMGPPPLVGSWIARLMSWPTMVGVPSGNALGVNPQVSAVSSTIVAPGGHNRRRLVQPPGSYIVLSALSC